ncbi:suppressor of glycerol defect [Xylographa trunciseda]|nr:suppressor of glycerol defect [Xylographa trunciseda]
MRQPTHNTAKLPRRLLDELGLQDGSASGPRGKRTGPVARKERRKTTRIEKKTREIRSQNQRRTHGTRRRVANVDSSEASEGSSDVAPPSSQKENQATPKSILKYAKPEPPKSSSVQIPQEEQVSHVPRSVRKKLAADDAEIEALERALGVKGKKSLPKAFEDDGLDDLLDGLDTQGEEYELNVRKRRISDEDEWLENKRKRARQGTSTIAEAFNEEDLGSLNEGAETESPPDDDQMSIEGDSESEDFNRFDSASTVPTSSTTKVRENPYVAPVLSTDAAPSPKYRPPSLRASNPSRGEGLRQLRRQMQGLLNRLSEANILGVLNNVEKIYQEKPRHDVSSTLIDLLMGLLSDPTILQDTFIILHAGLMAGVYKLVGIDFGAQIVQRIVVEFDKIFITRTDGDTNGKKLTNLISLLSELYNFQVVGSGLIYDFIRIFLEDLTEMNVELLLKVIRSEFFQLATIEKRTVANHPRDSGPQLRQDDPSALKAIVLLLQPALAKMGTENVSVRTKFMIETINNLKNNRMKTGLAASTITSEHTIRMKKTLGSLNTRNLKATAPLRIGLNDIRNTEKRGKWWLVGASYRDEDKLDEQITLKGSNSEIRADSQNNQEDNSTDNKADDLLQLAKQHRMNTDIRRSIFITIMSATDYRDAHLRLLKLRLKKSQELEIPKVLIHCAGAEAVYNPFYTLIARLLCSDRKLKMAFQFALWDLFKQMGEDEDEDDNDDEERDSLDTRTIVNLAKMFGALVADGGLTIGILKNLNLVYLQSKTRTFVELFLITIILNSQQSIQDHRNEKPLLDIFLKVKDHPDLMTGMHYFLKKVVSRTDVASGKQDRSTIKWACKAIDRGLQQVTSNVEKD